MSNASSTPCTDACPTSSPPCEDCSKTPSPTDDGATPSPSPSSSTGATPLRGSPPTLNWRQRTNLAKRTSPARKMAMNHAKAMLREWERNAVKLPKGSRFESEFIKCMLATREVIRLEHEWLTREL